MMCKTIAALYRQNFLNFTTVESEENCITFDDTTVETYHVKKRNKYISLFFSNYDNPKTEEEEALCEQVGNKNEKNAQIIIFLNRFIKIIKMNHSGDLDKEMFDILLNHYLDELKL